MKLLTLGSAARVFLGTLGFLGVIVFVTAILHYFEFDSTFVFFIAVAILAGVPPLLERYLPALYDSRHYVGGPKITKGRMVSGLLGVGLLTGTLMFVTTNDHLSFSLKATVVVIACLAIILAANILESKWVAEDKSKDKHL